MIKDFLKRKEIATHAKLIVSHHLNELGIKKIKESESDKAEKKLDKVIKNIKYDLSKLRHKEKYGVYGKAKLLKEVQNCLNETELTEETIARIMKELFYI